MVLFSALIERLNDWTLQKKTCNIYNATCFFTSRMIEIQTKYEIWGPVSSFNFLVVVFNTRQSLFACLHCRVIVLSPPLFCCCVAFTHTVPCLQTLALSSSLAKPLRLCQPLNALSWSFWHLTLLPAGRAALQGRRILLLRVCVALGGLESVWKAPWTIFGISHRIALLPSSQSSGGELKLWG